MDSHPQAKGKWLVILKRLTEKQIFDWTQPTIKKGRNVDDSEIDMQEIIDEGKN